MMKTHYLTFILRFRLDEQHAQGTVADYVSGSVPQAGLQEVAFFDPADKFQEAMRLLAAELTLSEV